MILLAMTLNKGSLSEKTSNDWYGLCTRIKYSEQHVARSDANNLLDMTMTVLSGLETQFVGPHGYR